jgi:hypothetical protein
MAVAVQMDFEGGTLAQYDEIVARMGFAPRGAGAPGGLFHWAAETDDGIRVVDVWESREQYEAFAQSSIGPLAQEAGVTEPPTVTYYDVHNYLTAG